MEGLFKICGITACVTSNFRTRTNRHILCDRSYWNCGPIEDCERSTEPSLLWSSDVIRTERCLVSRGRRISTWLRHKEEKLMHESVRK